MAKRRSLILPAIALAVVLFVVGGVYLAETAKALPSFFPGHDAASTTHHVKHGIAALLLGVACLVFAWFQTGPTRARTT